MNNGIFLKEMGKRIREIRKAKNISLEKLDVMINMDNGNLMRIEHGKINPHILTLKTIADALEVEVNDFL